MSDSPKANDRLSDTPISKHRISVKMLDTGYEVTLDGRILDEVTDLQISLRAGGPAFVTLTVPAAVEVEILTPVELSEVFDA